MLHFILVVIDEPLKGGYLKNKDKFNYHNSDMYTLYTCMLPGLQLV